MFWEEDIAQYRLPYFATSHVFFCFRERGVGRIARVLKSQGWRREAGDFTVFPTAADFPQFEDCLPHLKSRVQGEGVGCEHVHLLFLKQHCLQTFNASPYVCVAAHDSKKACWILEHCNFIIVDGHHRHSALNRLKEEYGPNVSQQLAPIKVRIPT
jgi:hypothetical protein